MRRPLLFMCVCLYVLIALGMQMTNPPPWSSEVAVATGENVFVVGQVYEKEYRVSFGKETIIFYLNLFDYSKEAETSYRESYQKFYNERTQCLTKIICEVNMSDLPRQGEDIYLPQLGERILLLGEWQVFAHATNPGEFDLANYYAIEDICGKVKLKQFLASDQKQWYIRETIFQLRQKLLKNLYDAFEQEDAAILAKMLLGDGSGLDKEVRDLYQDNGIVHILSISGLHISMIGMGIYTFLRKSSCPIGIAAVLGGIFIVFYGVLTGFGVSACRAIGMYLIRMLGELWGKTYDMLTAMGVLAVVMVMENPKLAYHSGYLLSFASVCGVGLLVPILPQIPGALEGRPYDVSYKKWLKKRCQKAWSSCMVSLSVTLFTLPLQLFFFYKVPIYSVFINLLVIPFMSIVMIIGFTVMLFPGLYFLCPVESFIFAWFEWLCRVFQELPGHTWITGRPQMWKVLVYYVGLMVVVCCGKRLKKITVMGALAGLVMFVGVRLHRENTITFLDVGQGDCICVQTASGECYLFDGGSSSKTNVGEKIIVPFLQYCGVSQLDAIFVSHPDADHTNGLEVLLTGAETSNGETMIMQREVTVERLILPRVANAEEEFKDLLLAAGETITVEYVAKGAVLEGHEIRLTCLHPSKGYKAESNAYSACYLLEAEEMSVLLTGDVEAVGESDLVRELKRKGIVSVDVLKVAHHGSRFSTSQEFLESVDVKLAVISCGKNNYGHPHEETLSRLIEEGAVIVTTQESGAVTVKLPKSGARIHYFAHPTGSAESSG